MSLVPLLAELHRLFMGEVVREHVISAGDVTPTFDAGELACCLSMNIRLNGAQFEVKSIRHSYHLSAKSAPLGNRRGQTPRHGKSFSKRMVEMPKADHLCDRLSAIPKPELIGQRSSSRRNAVG
jgi:hypothetical protein